MGKKKPIKALSFLLEKEGHCRNIFDNNINIIGTGFYKATLVQTFAYLPIYIKNPIIDGCFYNDCFYSTYIGNTTIYVNINGVNNSMTHLFGPNSYHFCTFEHGTYFFITDKYRYPTHGFLVF